MKQILVATDGSIGGDRAVDYAAQLAKDHGADLLIVNIIGAWPSGKSVQGFHQRSANLV